MIPCIKPSWSAPTWVNALTTTKEMDFSKNRQIARDDLKAMLNLDRELPWLNQTHSNRVVYVDHTMRLPIEADAAWTDQPGQACVVLTGDCLPLLLCDTHGKVVGAVHAGWRGILGGIIENTVMAMRTKTQAPILAWLGPAIGPSCFEVQADMVEPCIAADPFARGAFVQREVPGKWLANIYKLAKSRLRQVGVHHMDGEEYCTYTEQDRFFSARLTKTTSRMATLIWFNAI